MTDENEEVTVAVNEKVCPEFNSDRCSKEEDPFNVETSSLTNPVADSHLDFFQSDPFVGSDPFKDDPLGKLIHLVVILSKGQIHLHLTASSSSLLLILLPLQVLILSVKPAIAVTHR